MSARWNRCSSKSSIAEVSHLDGLLALTVAGGRRQYLETREGPGPRLVAPSTPRIARMQQVAAGAELACRIIRIAPKATLREFPSVAVNQPLTTVAIVIL
jgi:hypothetical protein